MRLAAIATRLIINVASIVVLTAAVTSALSSPECTQKGGTPYEALHIPHGDTPYFPFGEGIWLQGISADPRTGRFMLRLKAVPGASLGVHRHFGEVMGITESGAWGYDEHDFIARRGDIVHETPGSVHTLNISPDAGEETVILFVVDGALQFLTPEGDTAMLYDWRSLISLHEAYCAENGLDCIDISRKREAMPCVSMQ